LERKPWQIYSFNRRLYEFTNDATAIDATSLAELSPAPPPFFLTFHFPLAFGLNKNIFFCSQAKADEE
jgi:hypothetical protein